MEKFHPGNPPTTLEEFQEAVDEHKTERGRLALRVQKLDNDIKSMTCFTCKHESYCNSAWDMYNTNGDCLETK